MSIKKHTHMSAAINQLSFSGQELRFGALAVTSVR